MARFRVEVAYHGRPGNISFGGERPWNATSNEAMAMNEPHIAPWWFAANDHPSDKATFDISISVPRGQQVLSNGTLLSHRADGDLTSWHWRMTDPMTTYLAFFAAGSFAIRSGVHDGLPYTIAASKHLGDVPGALALLRRTPAVVAWLQTQLGRYPFTSTGGVMTSAYAGFSLENATRPTHSPNANANTVVHELAHQWFGDDVSVAKWRDIWLNEGFASYMTWRYDEDHGGESTQQELLYWYDRIGQSSPFWSREVGDPGAKHLFGDPVYVRGEMTLAALRHRLGDDAFTRILRTWIADHAGGNGSIAQFERRAESVSGQHLRGFFTAWLFTGSKPARTKANGLV